MLFKLRYKGWEKADIQAYRQAYESFGGSFINHPSVLTDIAELTQVAPDFYIYQVNNEMMGGIATWGKYIAGDKRALRKLGVHALIDVGCPDLILPLKPQIKFQIPFASEHVANIHAEQIPNSRVNHKNQLSLFKSFESHGISNKTQSQLRRLLRKFEEVKGEARLLTEFSAEELYEIYIKLHFQRWGQMPLVHEFFVKTMQYFHKYLFGYVVSIDQEPLALHINYSMQNKNYMVVDFVNSGLSIHPKHDSVGTVLFYLNLLKATQESKEKQVQLRYSFGNHDLEYKKRWCNPVPLLKV